MKSMYGDKNEWVDELFKTFPKNVRCPVCESGTFDIEINGAVVNAVCGHCRTSVPYRFYDVIYPFLEMVKKKSAKAA